MRMKKEMSMRFITVCGFLAILTLIAVICLLGSWYTINESDRGIITKWGKVVAVAEPGLGFKIPIITEVETISISNRSIKYDRLKAYSKDQQPAQMVVSIGFQVPPASVEDLFVKYGSIQNMAERLVSRHVPTQVENVFGQYTAVSAVQNREDFVRRVTEELRLVLKDEPLIINSVNIENIDFTEGYEASIEERMKAEVNVEKTRKMLETEKINADIAIEQARGQSESQLSIAKIGAEKIKLMGAAEAETIRLMGAAEAEAIKLRADALKQNPLLVELITAEKWNGELPQTMLPNSSVPFINARNKDGK
ncbi:prohibitin family protein [Yersinia similis]|uniref:Putative SPFH domain-containing protein n=1 Tax=Yersinia similis TaxID=367190 RepID=A0A0T9P260_9GAMM|nr:prohibitin family protein [Yersinia similis]CNF26663.1 putative SPFH domain-containing protein [Yersinia similis]CNH41663.1 putative SPFH domain-containing protein [Yersinia similis]